MSSIKKTEGVNSNQLNEHDQFTDKTVLRNERYKFGFVNILYQGEELGLGPIHTVIARALGGSTMHIGICGAINTAYSITQWMGALLLKKCNSNQKAMRVALLAGASCAFTICCFIFLGLIPSLRCYSLWAYLMFAIMLSGLTGIQWNIETGWIGDLVAQKIRGWFTSAKYIMAVFGQLCFMLLFGRLADAVPRLTTYAGLFFIVAISHIIAVFVVARIIDRVPKNANFVSSGASHADCLNYKSAPLWCYIIFFILWGCGRTSLNAFTTVYLIDCFNCSITQIMSILAIQNVISIILLFVLGKLSDKFGNRKPLLFISAMVPFSMLLWVASAWWGIAAIIIYQVVNGAAGSTHSMLAINYGLEIFPDKGRAAYMGFTRIIVGTACIAAPVISGRILHRIEGFNFVLWGAQLNHYHCFFMVCSLIAFLCIVPVMIAGKRTINPKNI